MVRLQQLTGARPGEVIAMRADGFDASGEVWEYWPRRHKTAHHGRGRVVFLGPKVREVVRPFLEAARPDGYLFRPGAAVEDRNAARRAARKTPMTPSQSARRPKARPKWAADPLYPKHAYRNAIWRACDRLHPHPTLVGLPRKEITEAQREELRAWRREHRWHLNRLRHTAATEIRAKFGLEGAQVTLGRICI